MPLNSLTKKNYGLLGKEKGKLSFITETTIVLYQIIDVFKRMFSFRTFIYNRKINGTGTIEKLWCFGKNYGAMEKTMEL